MSTFASEFKNHPFSSLRSEECLRVHSPGEFCTVLSDQVKSTIFTTNISSPASIMVHQDQGWRVIPRLGDMIHYSGQTLVFDGENVIPLEKTNIPIPVHPFLRLYVRDDVKEIDYMNLRLPERNILIDWESVYGK